jgi:hypothetical protein
MQYLTSPRKQRVSKGCRLSPQLRNIFINDIFEYINTLSYNAPLMGGTTVTGLLFAHDLAVSSFTSKGRK